MRPLVLALASILLIGGEAFAQARAPGVTRPGDRRPEIPAFEEEVQPRLELPELEPATGGLAPGLFVSVRGYRFTGNSVFSDDELAALTAPWVRAGVTSEDLLAARNAVTLHYVEAGYVNSGAYFPDQDAEDGVILLRIVEGRLVRVEIEGSGRLRRRWVESWLGDAESGPLNVNELEQALQMMQADSRVAKLDAALRPGAARGEGVLLLQLSEAPVLHAQTGYDNHQPPSVGAEGPFTHVWHDNLTGLGDTPSLRWRMTEGFDEWLGDYDLPITKGGLRLVLHYEGSQSEVVESPFDDLDIESRFSSYGVGLKRYLVRSPRNLFELGALFEYRRSRSYILDDPFAFEGADDDAYTKVSVLRLSQTFTRRSSTQVLSVNSMFSFGIDLLDATTASGSAPDARFVSWLGQVQWVRRIEPMGADLIFRSDVQLANSALLSLEQFAIGGHASVRGYRENQIVRDNGIVSSLELRAPLYRSPDARSSVEVGLFVDFGYGWNHRSRSTPQLRDLTSVGITLGIQLMDRVVLRGSWAPIRRDLDTGGDAQDNGLHFGARIVLF